MIKRIGIRDIFERPKHLRSYSLPQNRLAPLTLSKFNLMATTMCNQEISLPTVATVAATGDVMFFCTKDEDVHDVTLLAKKNSKSN